MQVLVLNQDYQAISLCTPERAIVLVLLEKAEMVADVTHRKMRSVSMSFPFPSVIRLRAFVSLPYRKVALTRQNIYKRDGGQCVYCGSTHNLTLDHVVPRTQGGRTTWNNLVTACQKCNAEKGPLSPEEAGMEMAHRPFRPSFLMFVSRFSGRIQEPWKPYLLIG